MVITKIEGKKAIAEINGIQSEVNISFTPDVKVGEKVLIHAGFIIDRLSDEKAAEMEKTWLEYIKVMEDFK